MESPFDGQGLNRYAYVSNNPVMRIDPSGFQEESPPGLDGNEHETLQTDAEITARLMAEDRANFPDFYAEQEANALWEEILASESAQAGDVGNLNMDLVGAPSVAPSPMVLDFRPQGPGDRYNPYDYSKFGTSLFGERLRPPPAIQLGPGNLLYELHPASSVLTLLDANASAGEKAVAVIMLIPAAKLLKLGKVAAAAKAMTAGAARGTARMRWPSWQFGNTNGALGTTDMFGNITIQPGLSGQVLQETLRHEAVHSVLGPAAGGGLQTARATFGQWRTIIRSFFVTSRKV